MCIKLVIIKKLYYDARPTKYQEYLLYLSLKLAHKTMFFLFVPSYRHPQGARAPSGPGPPHYRRFTITHRHTTLGTRVHECTSDQPDDLYQTTNNNHKRHWCSSGIRTHNPGKRAAADPRLRPHGHWDRLLCA